MKNRQARNAGLRVGLLLVIGALAGGSAALAQPRHDARVAPPASGLNRVPGVVIDHRAQSSRVYIGSPSLAILTNGDYVAAHDFFGPGSANNRTAVFRSPDRGATWRRIAELDGQWWSTLFVHRGALYLLGTTKEYGNAVIRRSPDGGDTWTTPADATTGLLRADGQYHCAPMPVIAHAGRLWRAMERRDPPRGWGLTFCAGMLSAPADADLLHATNWTASTFLPGDATWLGGGFGGWLEGNAVVTGDGRMVDVLRVDTPACPEKAALVEISADGRTARFDPQNGFIDFPGGAKKFTIRRDPREARYWSLASVVPERHEKEAARTRPGSLRNTLALTASTDLRHWSVRCVLLYHPDPKAHGFQYVDWQFDGDDLIAVCRTAYDDGLGGAHNYHDANFLTFHRWKHFRDLAMADSAAMPEAASPRVETADFILTGRGFELASLTNGARAFSNRAYTWQGLTGRSGDWRFTRLAGGERAEITVRAKRDARLTLATATSQRGLDSRGWDRLPDADFFYTDAGKTRMQVFQQPIQAGQELILPQGNWTGGVLLLPPETPAAPPGPRTGGGAAGSSRPGWPGHLSPACHLPDTGR